MVEATSSNIHSDKNTSNSFRFGLGLPSLQERKNLIKVS